MSETKPWKPWEKVFLTDEQRAEIRTVPHIAIRDDYSRLALCWAEVDADAIVQAHNAPPAALAEALRKIRAMEKSALSWEQIARQSVIIAYDALREYDAAALNSAGTGEAT